MRSGACPRCGRGLAAAHASPDFLCGACRQRPPAFDRAVSGWSYEPPLNGVIRGLKFGRLEYLGKDLGLRLAERLRQGPGTEEKLLGDLDAVVPIPLHWLRKRRRGYNQAELIAGPLASELGLPMLPALVRRRATAPQSGADRKTRQRNLRRAFRLSRRFHTRDRVRNRKLLLVDDVLTTGATLEEAAQCLRKAGAARIVAVTIARTPVPRG